MFKEHSTLPGEWPWYGAHNPNHGIVLLWRRWLEDSGAAGLQRWHMHILTLFQDGLLIVVR